MRKTSKSPGEKIVKDIKRATRKQYSAEEKIQRYLSTRPLDVMDCEIRCKSLSNNEHFELREGQ